METADADLTQMAMGHEDPRGQGMYGINNPVMNPGYQPGDEKLFVKFYVKAREDKVASKRAGRPIFKDTDYIEIMQPGNKENIIQRPVTKKDIDRFYVQYQRYKANEDQKIIGTPLDQAPFVTRSQVEELKYMNIFTIEQLAGMSDSNAQNGRGFQTLKQKASVFMDAAENSKDNTAMVEELDLLKNQLAAMKENNEILQKRLDDLEATHENSKSVSIAEEIEEEVEDLEE